MIVIDTSALVAVLEKEPEHVTYATAMHAAQRCLVSALTVYEASVVMLGKRGAAGVQDLQDLMTAVDVEIVPFDHAAAVLATSVYVRFGKGRGHAAGLNICDCASYALAKVHDVPLLFKGGDFPETDIVARVPSGSSQ